MAPSDLSPQIFRFEGQSLTFSNTPWDSTALDKLAINISSIDSGSGNPLPLVKAFIKKIKDEGIKFCSIRIPANNQWLKHSLQSGGFTIVEHTLDVTSSSFDKKKATELLNKIPVITSNDAKLYIPELQSIAQDAFHFGRFHEDPKITLEQASLRNKNWINDLISQKAVFNILLKKDKVIGFMAFKTTEENHTKLLFGGVSQNYQHLSYSFWSDTLIKIFDSSSISTTISSSNTPVLNLYSYFGFHFTKPQIGLHLHL